MPRIWPTAPRGEADGERSMKAQLAAAQPGDRLLHAWQILARSRRSARQPAMLAVEAERWLPPDPPSNALATERSQLLAAVRAATNEVLSRGLADGLRCDASAVRRLCFTLEVAGAHQLLPPFFALQPPGLWHALQQMQLRMRDAPPAWSEDASVRAMLEALALARDLADQHLWGHEAATALRDDYAARLWLCLALAARAQRVVRSDRRGAWRVRWRAAPLGGDRDASRAGARRAPRVRAARRPTASPNSSRSRPRRPRRRGGRRRR